MSAVKDRTLSGFNVSRSAIISATVFEIFSLLSTIIFKKSPSLLIICQLPEKIVREAVKIAIIFIRTIILYFAILVSMRIMGKHQLGEMELSEFIVAALIADLAATPLQDIGIPLLNGLIPIVTLFCLEVIIAGFSLKNIRFRSLAFGKPEILIRNGKINIESMHKNRFTPDELMQELRSQGIESFDAVSYAILETNGKLSIILRSEEQPVTPKQLNLNVCQSGYPHIIINEGRVLDKNLHLLGRSRNWLSNELKRRSIKDPKDVYLLTLSDQGEVFCQLGKDAK